MPLTQESLHHIKTHAIAAIEFMAWSEVLAFGTAVASAIVELSACKVSLNDNIPPPRSKLYLFALIGSLFSTPILAVNAAQNSENYTDKVVVIASIAAAITFYYCLALDAYINNGKEFHDHSYDHGPSRTGVFAICAIMLSGAVLARRMSFLPSSCTNRNFLPSFCTSRTNALNKPLLKNKDEESLQPEQVTSLRSSFCPY